MKPDDKVWVINKRFLIIVMFTIVATTFIAANTKIKREQKAK